MYRTKTSLLLAAVAASQLADTAAADIRAVPSQFPTIQAAIDAAVDGDEVLIAPGVYSGPLFVDGKTLTIRGNGPTAADVIVQNAGAGSVLEIAGSDVQLHGLTITGGAGTSARECGGPGVFGGGVFARASVLRIENVVLTGNAAEFGGGLYGVNSTITVIGSTFANNQTTALGAAIAVCPLSFSGGLLVEDCTFENNTPISGFGVIDLPSGNSTIRNSTFTGNSKEVVRFVGNNATILIEGSTFVSNQSVNGVLSFPVINAGTNIRISDTDFTDSAGGSVGGLFLSLSGGTVEVDDSRFDDTLGTAIFAYIDAGSELTVNRSVFRRTAGPAIITNVNDGSATIANTLIAGGAGEGLFLLSSQSAGTTRIINTTVADNLGFGIRAEALIFGEALVENSILSGNGSGELQAPISPLGTLTISNSITQGDPGFTDRAASDYTLRADSPALDTGNSAAAFGDFDLAGGDRIVGAAIDLGAFELQNGGCPADWDNSGGVDGDDIGAFFSDWTTGNADIDGSGGTDGDDISFFFARWTSGC